MNEEIIEYCSNAILYMNDDNNNYEEIISLVLKDLKENDIVYINRTKKWYKYNKKDKIWIEYNFNIIISKITELYEFFEDIIGKYLENNNTLNLNNKNRFKIKSKNIASYILNHNINTEKLDKISCKIFSINNKI